jgi:hypothetical protein
MFNVEVDGKGATSTPTSGSDRRRKAAGCIHFRDDYPVVFHKNTNTAAQSKPFYLRL